MRIQADCLELRAMAQHMRSVAIEYSIISRATRGMGMSLPVMPSHTSALVSQVVCNVPDELMEMAQGLIDDASEIYERADWFELAGSGGGVSWLFGTEARPEVAGKDRLQWGAIVDGAIMALSAPLEYGQHSRRTASRIAKIWRWSPSATRRSQAAGQIRSAGSVTKWATSKWIRGGGWFLAAVDGVVTYNRYVADEASRAEALARAAAEVGTPALAGWGAAVLCGAGVAASPFTAGTTAVVACGIVGAGAAVATDQLGVGEEVGDLVVEGAGLDD